MSLLDGIRVLDISTELSGSYATKLLADAGADVVKLESPDGDPMRRWTACREDAGSEGGPLFEYLNADKRSVVGSVGDVTGRALVAGADVLVESGSLSDDELVGLRHGHPALTVVSVSPFGRSGPWRDRPATEFTVQASAGAILGRGDRRREPVQVGGRLGEWITGTYAAIGAVAAARAARSSGLGDHVDVSMLEAVAATMPLSSPLAGSLGAAPPKPRRNIEVPSVEPTADGFVGFCTVTGQQFQDFLVMIGHPELIDDAELASFAGRQARRDEFVALVHEWTRKHTTEEVIDKASAFRIPVAPIGEPTTITSIDHLEARGIFASAPCGRFEQPRAPYQVDGHSFRALHRAPRLGADQDSVSWESRSAITPTTEPTRPLDGIRVIDFTAFWAGPAASCTLAQLGADVVKVESVQRPDGMRFAVIASVAGEESWWERSAGFHMSNTNKRGVTLDLKSAQGRDLLDQLLCDADVLIENFTPRVLDHFGLDRITLHELNPRLITVRMPAFGLDGPWRDRPGFAQTIEQASGLVWMTGFPDEAPLNPRGPCDPIAGLTAAFATLAVLEERERSGSGHHVECAMIEAALNVAVEPVIEHQVYGATLHRDGNRSPTAAPQGVYRSARDEEWVAISVRGDADWIALRHVLDEPEWAADPSFDTEEGRRRGHDEIDTALSDWASGQDPATAVDSLIRAGVPAAVLIDGYEMDSCEQLAARGYLEHVDVGVPGSHVVATLPFRLQSARSRWITRAAPTLGQHNEEILGAELGLDESRLSDLAHADVIGTRPLGL